MKKIPCDEHIRQMLDPMPPKHFYDEFHTILQQINKQGKLKAYQILDGNHVLLSLDGTEYFNSYEIECGRTRWKVQNKNNNVKTKGYRHGSKLGKSSL